MATSLKSHKGMSDSEWISRLRKFANTGSWPAEEGNRPAPRQKKWYQLYQKIDKCPKMGHSHQSLFGHERHCTCGFHTQKPTTASTSQGPTAQQAVAVAPILPGTVGQQAAAVGPTLPGTVGQKQSTAGSALPKQRPLLNLSMFTKPRFGGSHVSAAKPNLNATRRVTQTQATNLPTSSPASIAILAPDPQTLAQASVPALSTTAVCATVSTADSRTETETQLPRLWSEGLPPVDHKWIVKSLFKMGPKGKLVLKDNLKLWHFPPQPSNLYHQAPAADPFFAHPLLVWMPYKLWKVKVVCPNLACGGHQLTGAGLHKRARRVLDVDRMYNMVTETLTCTKCRSSHVSWSQTVLKQLSKARQTKFRVILTQKYACDIRVIRNLRDRGLGNSPTQLLKKLKENHTEEWFSRSMMFTEECMDFSERPALLPLSFPEAPMPAVVPSVKWLLSVYCQDILTRVEDIKARITSTYGTVLKMDSTRKITKKLAGTAKGTAHWLTSVGNEYGQVLISVMTAQEGAGLDFMTADLVKRYQQAGVDPPVALYVDCGCCTEAGETKLKARFSGWPDIIVRLDIWHFMRRLALGCTTDAHQLYPGFMSRLSSSIFEWDAADLAMLREAKRQQLRSQGLPSLTDGDVTKQLSREEMALHCRRRTRGEETTIRLLEELLGLLMGSRGNDSSGVPLFDSERMEHIWRVQRKHVKCIQDPPGVALYIKTGGLTKGGVRLPVYRCARGSTSLESFHLHLNRFIPGTSANSLNFQMYLLEGLHRWNQDRGVAALSTAPSSLRSYSGDLVQAVNQNYQKLYGRKLVPEFCPPSQYTGELIGMQYLFRQTGQALQDMNPDSEEAVNLIEQHDVDSEEDEGFTDITDDPTVLNPGVLQASASQPPDPSASSSCPLSLVPGTSTLAPGTSTLAPGTSSVVPVSSTLAPGTSTLAPGSSSVAHCTVASSSSSEEQDDIHAVDEDMAVDDQNLPGYQHVDRLAEYLVELRGQTALCLTNQQASAIVSLWDKLNEGDKQRVVYAARHQARLLSGRFRTPKKPSKTPGVESTTRCMLGASSVPAQWPDCCRLVETIFIRLCSIHQSPSKKGKRTDSRWSLILRDYRKIRQLVVGNCRVMQGSEIQLVEVNQSTLIQWHNTRQKKQELSVLLQGTALPPALAESDEPLQEARVLPAAPTPARKEHQYHLPQSTAGQAKQRPVNIRPKGPEKRKLFATPPAPAPAPAPLITPHILTSSGLVQIVFPVPIGQGSYPQTSAPTSTVEAAPPPKRPYRRTVTANTCKKCGQFRTALTGHSHYHGRVYCPNSEALTKDQWLEEMRKNM